MAIIMVMGSMGIDMPDLDFYKRLNPVFLLLSLTASLFAKDVLALEWQIRPNITMSEMFGDNLNLSSINSSGSTASGANTVAIPKKSGFVTELSPGMRLFGQSALSTFNLNYRLQGLYNNQGSDAVNVFHQLQSSSLFQFIQNTFYLQTSSSIAQVNTSNTFTATDNIAGRNNITQTENFNFTPYLTPHFGQYATGLLKAGYSGSFFNNPNTGQSTASTVINPITNTNTLLTQAGLTSGSYFNVVSWGLNYSSQDQRAANTNTAGTATGNGDVRFEDYTSNLRYFINRQFNVFAQAGYENNGYQTQANSTGGSNNNGIKNGFEYTVGGQWKPSLWYSLEVGAGNNSHVTVQYNPATNLTSHVTYNYKNVGLNLGSSWDASLAYSTTQANWGLTYHQDTQTTQQLQQQLLNQIGFNTNPGSAGNILNPGFNLVNGVVISKTASLNVSYRTGKSTFNASANNSRRSNQTNLEQDTIYSLTGGWQWQFIPRLNFYLQPLWQSTKSSQSALALLAGQSSQNADSTLFQVSMGLTRGIPINLGRPLLLNTTLDLRHIEQSSALVNNSYTENRATANFFVQF